MMSRSLTLKVMVFLALAQGILGLLRAFLWFRIGSEIGERGILIGPLMALLASLRGGIVVTVALLYLVFAWGAWGSRQWAWGLGLLVSVANVLGVVAVLLEGEPVAFALLLSIVPVVLLGYLLSPAGRQAFTRL